MALPAFVIVGSLFFFFVNWFSEVKRDRIDAELERAALVVLKKLPAAVSTDLVSIFSNTGTEYQSAAGLKEETAVRDAQPAVDLFGPQQKAKKLPSPSDDVRLITSTPSSNFQEDETSATELPDVEKINISVPPEEPDPALAIDYVFKKRKP
jgi:hypothetical protein